MCVGLILFIFLSIESWGNILSLRENGIFSNLPVRIALDLTSKRLHLCSTPLQESISSFITLLVSRNITYDVIAFVDSSPGAVFYDQEYLHYLLDLNTKLDFHCLNLLPEKFRSCMIQRSLRDDIKGLFLSSSCNERNEMGFLYYNYSSLSSLGRSVDIKATANIDPSIRYQTEVYSRRQSHESDGACDLWWPLNNTDILLYNYIPQNLPFLKIETTCILKCLLPTKLLQETDVATTITLTDYVENIDKQQAYTNTHQRKLSFEESRFDERGSRVIPVIFTTKVLLEFAVTVEPVRKKKLSLTFDDGSHRLATFNLSLNILYLNEILQTQRSKTMNYSYDLYSLQTWLSHIESRDDLGFLFSALFPPSSNHSTVFVEVGVNKGNYAKILLNTWPTLSMYVGIDAWKTWTEEEYLDIANYDEHEENYVTTIENLLDTPTETAKLIIRQESVEAASLFKEGSVDVVYLDAMHHYSAVYEDMTTWWPKIRPGGILAGHDYLLGVESATIFTVKPAVDTFARERNLIILQTNDLTHPSFPSWFIVKPSY